MSFLQVIELPASARPMASRRPSSAAFGRRFALIVAALVVTATALRLTGIGSRALWLDEAYSHWFSARGWAELWLVVPTYEPHPPFYYSLLKLWRIAVGDDPAALRGLSALAGIVAVPVMALVGRELARLTASPRPLLLAAVAGALAAFSPRLLLIAQEARPYPLLVLAYAGAILGWLRLTRAFRASRPGTRSEWSLIGVSTAALLWLHGLGLLYAAGLLLALVLSARAADASLPVWRRLALTVGLVTLAYLPGLIMIATQAGDWGTGWLVWKPELFPAQLLVQFGLAPSGEMLTPWLSVVVLPVLMIAGARVVHRSSASLGWGMGLLVLVPPIAAALISQLHIPVFLPRTLIAILVPAYLLVAVAIANLPRRLGVACGAAVALLFAVNAGFTLARPAQEPWGDIAAILRRDMQPRDIIWVYPNDLALPLSQALGGGKAMAPIPAAYPALDAVGHRRSGSRAVVAIDGRLARDWVAQHRPAPGTRVWLVQGGDWLFDPGGYVAAALKHEFRQAARWSFGPLTLTRLDPASPRAVPAAPTGATAAR